MKCAVVSADEAQPTNTRPRLTEGGGKKNGFPTTRPTPSGSNAKHSRTFSPGNRLKILATGCVCLPSNGGTEPAGQADQETEDVPNNKVDGKEESRKEKKNCNDVTVPNAGQGGGASTSEAVDGT